MENNNDIEKIRDWVMHYFPYSNTNFNDWTVKLNLDTQLIYDYLCSINKSNMDIRRYLINFCDSIRDYERESHNLIGFDERESSEFVDQYLSNHKNE
jgi:hypothetical protein